MWQYLTNLSHIVVLQSTSFLFSKVVRTGMDILFTVKASNILFQTISVPLYIGILIPSTMLLDQKTLCLQFPSLRKMGLGHGWDNSWYPPSGYQLGELCES